MILITGFPSPPSAAACSCCAATCGGSGSGGGPCCVRSGGWRGCRCSGADSAGGRPWDPPDVLPLPLAPPLPDAPPLPPPLPLPLLLLLPGAQSCAEGLTAPESPSTATAVPMAQASASIDATVVRSAVPLLPASAPETPAVDTPATSWGLLLPGAPV